MDWGWIRHPVPSSPHFPPNRYKLGMKSLAPCQHCRGARSSLFLPLVLPDAAEMLLQINRSVHSFLLMLCLNLIHNLQEHAVLCIGVAGWFLMRRSIRPVGVNVYWSDLREGSFSSLRVHLDSRIGGRQGCLAFFIITCHMSLVVCVLSYYYLIIQPQSEIFLLHFAALSLLVANKSRPQH